MALFSLSVEDILDEVSGLTVESPDDSLEEASPLTLRSPEDHQEDKTRVWTGQKVEHGVQTHNLMGSQTGT